MDERSVPSRRLERQPTAEERRRIERIRWYHSMRFGDIVTRGERLLSQSTWIARVMPADLRSRSVLDVGAWDGYFSFEAERRGAARVLAIDSLQGWHAEEGTAGFDFAKELYGSDVEFRVFDVLDLDRLDEEFDLVLFFGVYYHLVDPIRALQVLARRLRPGGHLLMEGLVLVGTEPHLRAFRPDEIEPTTYCGATLPWLMWCLEQAGFRDVTVLDGTWRIRSALKYYRDWRPLPSLLLFALGSSLQWLLRIRRLPGRHVKTYRALLTARKA